MRGLRREESLALEGDGATSRDEGAVTERRRQVPGEETRGAGMANDGVEQGRRSSSSHEQWWIECVSGRLGGGRVM